MLNAYIIGFFITGVLFFVFYGKEHFKKNTRTYPAACILATIGAVLCPITLPVFVIAWSWLDDAKRKREKRREALLWR